jgi:hypothetical protein
LHSFLGTQTGTVDAVGTPDRNADWWTTTDVADYLGVTISTVSAYRGRGQMPAPDRTIGRTHVWTPARIIEWHEARPGRGARAKHTEGTDSVHAVEDGETRRKV